MPQPTDAMKLAVLIDGENVSANISKNLFEEISKLGKPVARRVFGNFRSAHMNGWEDKLPGLAIRSCHQPSFAGGKNSADIALVIEAMDLLHQDRVDGFCIVSSDSDFTSLAVRIREVGSFVYVFGESKTPVGLRQASTRFFDIAKLSAPAVDVAKAVPRPHTLRKPPSAAAPLLKRAIKILAAEEEWHSLETVRASLKKMAPEFESEEYGYASLSDLASKTGCFDVEPTKSGAVRIRLKQKPAQKKSNRKVSEAVKA